MALIAVPSQLKTPPVIPGRPILGNALDLQSDPIAFLEGIHQRYGDVVGIHLPGGVNYFVFHPDGIRIPLQDNARNYHKHIYIYEMLYPLVGRGLLTSDGDFWLRQRRLAQPAFHRQRIALFTKMMVSEAAAMCQRWEGAAQSEATLDVEQEMTYLTLNIVGKALLSLDMGTEAAHFARAFVVANAGFSFKNVFSLFYPWLPTPVNLRKRRALKVMDDFVYQIIRDRRSMPVNQRPQDDLLAMFMETVDEETGERMTDRQLRDEIITILLAGHETTALGLTWTWYFLSQHPQVLQKMRQELDEVLGGRLPTVEDFPRLEYTRHVFEEALRFYPPAWTIGRGAFQEDEICGYRIPSGAIVQVSIHTLHHDERFWQDPERFDPERFTPQNSSSRHKFAYLPFSTGPRKCIGDQFALTEAVLILATVAQAYDLRLLPGHPVARDVMITQRPRYGMQMIPQRLRG